MASSSGKALRGGCQAWQMLGFGLGLACLGCWPAQLPQAGAGACKGMPAALLLLPGCTAETANMIALTLLPGRDILVDPRGPHAAAQRSAQAGHSVQQIETQAVFVLCGRC